MANTGFSEEILDGYPQPLAATYARFIDQPDPTAQHNLLLALFEATLKYVTLAVSAECLAREPRDPAVEAALAPFNRPSLGHWVGLLRAVLAWRRRQPGQGAAFVFPELLALYDRPAPQLEHGAALRRELHRSGDTRISLRQLFDLLVEYRNQQAHGAGAGAGHYAGLVPLLQAVVEEILLAIPSLRTHELLFVDSVSVERGGGRSLALLRMMSDRPRLRGQRVLLGPGQVHPEPQQLYLRRDDVLADALGLHPLAIFVPACAVCGEAQVGLLNGATVSGVEYLSYGCGHTNLVPALTDELRALLPAVGMAATAASVAPPEPPAQSELALREAPAVPQNLPAEQASFIGREREIAALTALLRRPAVRLVTLVGPAGAGKTRLALNAARQLLPDFPAGVWFVDLSPQTDPAMVPVVLAEVLGIHQAGSRSLLQQLQAELAQQQMLIIMDNFEQVTAPVGVVNALLKATSGIKILATSRTPLRIYGEKELPVQPLALPARDKLPPLDRLSSYDAVRLFIERARDVRPDFELTADNAAAVAEICIQLDGLPLAIELAAARVKLLSPQALLARLDQRLKLLTSGALDLPERQRTLRGAIEWSYDLLDAGEQQLFRRLAIFQGGRTLDAAEAICNAAGDLRLEVLDGMESLLNKSLLQQRESRNGESRFLMLGTIQEYAAERLRESGEWADLAQRHARYYLDLAERAARQLAGPQQEQWLAQLDDEIDNMRASLGWALGAGNDEPPARLLIGLRLIGALERLWVLRSHYSEGRRWVDAALARLADLAATGAAADDALELALAGALYTGGRLTWQQGDFAAAQPLLERSLAISRRLGDRQLSARTLNDLGVVVMTSRNDSAAARRLWEESLELSQELGDERGVGLVLGNLGNIALQEGDPRTARRYLTQTQAIIREWGEKSLHAIIQANLAIAALQEGDYPAAQAALGDALRLYLELGDKVGIAHSLTVLSEIELRRAALAPQRVESPTTLSICRRAATLLAAVDTLLEASASALEPLERGIYEHSLAELCQSLGEQELAAARQEGATMTVDQAVEYAVG